MRLVVCVVTTVLVFAPACGSDEIDARQPSVLDTVEEVDALDSATAASFVDVHAPELLSKGVADAADGAALASVFRKALSTENGRDGRLGAVAAAVAEEGSLHSLAVSMVLAEVVADNGAWLDERVNAPFESLSRGEVPDAVVREYLAAHDLLREVIDDGDAATAVRDGLDDYAESVVGAAPEAGVERATRLSGLARLRAFVDIAQANAEESRARRAGDIDAIEAAIAAAAARTIESHRQLAGWLVTDRFSEDPAVRAAASGLPFVDDRGVLVDPMSEAQHEAFLDWSVTLVASGGLLEDDFMSIGAGATDITTRDMALNVKGRVRDS
jgi:hypothetical protein